MPILFFVWLLSIIATNAKPDVRALSKFDMARSKGLIGESEYGGFNRKSRD